MRLGAQIFESFNSPQEWISILKRKNMRAAYCPVDENAGSAVISEYRKAAQDADIVISEVGAWGYSLVHADPDHRKKAFDYFVQRIRLADEIGAGCTVSVSGSRDGIWDRPHKLNQTEETFEMLVGIIQKMIDTAEPRYTKYALEPMPWMFPDSRENMKSLLDAVNRDAFAVHYDPVNIITTHDHFFNNGEYMKKFVETFGKQIVSCHLKDVAMDPAFNVVIWEKKAGGADRNLDYKALFTALENLDPEMPVMIEHLQNEEENLAAEQYIRSQAEACGVTL